MQAKHCRSWRYNQQHQSNALQCSWKRMEVVEGVGGQILAWVDGSWSSNLWHRPANKWTTPCVTPLSLATAMADWPPTHLDR
jgi:hypothetical protein